MGKERLTREEREDREDLEEAKRILDDPNTEWVEWRKLDAEILSNRQQGDSEIDPEVTEAATGQGQAGYL